MCVNMDPCAGSLLLRFAVSVILLQETTDVTWTVSWDRYISGGYSVREVYYYLYTSVYRLSTATVYKSNCLSTLFAKTFTFAVLPLCSLRLPSSLGSHLIRPPVWQARPWCLSTSPETEHMPSLSFNIRSKSIEHYFFPSKPMKRERLP
jgi:hypothetical protein